MGTVKLNQKAKLLFLVVIIIIMLIAFAIKGLSQGSHPVDGIRIQQSYSDSTLVEIHFKKESR